MRVRACVCVCVCTCVYLCVCYLSNKYHPKRYFGDFFHYFPQLLTFSVTIPFHCLKRSWQFLRWIQKSGTNGNLSHRKKRGITLDLQNKQKEHCFRYDMVSNTHTFFKQISYVEKLFSACAIFYRIRTTPQEDNSPPYRFWSWRVVLFRGRGPIVGSCPGGE